MGKAVFTNESERYVLKNDEVEIILTADPPQCEILFPHSGMPSTRFCSFEFRYREQMIEGSMLAGCPRSVLSRREQDRTEAELQIQMGVVKVRWVLSLPDEGSMLFIRLYLEGNDIISSNYLCPVYVQGRAFPLPGAERPRLLYVPYDNDKWIRYQAQELQTCGTSYEVTSVYDDASRQGYIIGSVTHDQWKTGIITHGGYGELSMLRAYGGAADANTRDPWQRHGAVRGKTIASPVIMIACADDFRRGLISYGEVNARLAPPPPWKDGVIFGWNSWACLTTSIDLPAYLKVSETFEKWKENGFENRGQVYVNFDSFWDRLTQKELEEAVRTVHARGQKAGIYYTPFTCWTRELDRVVEDTDGQYTWRDLILRDEHDNPIPPIAGGYPVDPTHPGNVMRVNRRIRWFLDMGFDYLKVDFMSHGACEGVHYLRSCTTGVEAYHYGLKKMWEPLQELGSGKSFFVDFSIAPLFPHGYAHARRVSCDSFGQIYDTEYMLNSMTYAFWQCGTVYAYTDPDHTCLYRSVGRPVSALAEARSRLLASVISGTVLLLSDDYRNSDAVSRTEALLTREYLDVARCGRVFLPVECSQGTAASRFFCRDDGDRVYLAAFHYGEEDTVLELPLARLGKVPDNARFVSEADGMDLTGPVLRIPLGARACTLLHWDRR